MGMSPYIGIPPYWGTPPARQAILTALYRDIALLRPHYWGTLTVRQAILTALYRNAALYGDTALLGNPYCTTSDFDRLASGYRLIGGRLVYDKRF